MQKKRNTEAAPESSLPSQVDHGAAQCLTGSSGCSYEVVQRRHVGCHYQVDLLQLKSANDQQHFGRLWSAAEVLADHIVPLYLMGKKVLELGCGLGLPSLLAAQAGAEVTAIDGHQDAEVFMKQNRKTLGVAVKFSCKNWSDFAVDQAYDLILGSDILYQSWQVDQVIDFLDRAMTEKSLAIIVDPGRPHGDHFLRRLREAEYQVELSFDSGSEEGQPVEFCTYQIRL